MWNFIDDSGSFSWSNKGCSLFCGVTVSDAELPHLTERFIDWKRSVIARSRRELKGQELTSNQVDSFARKVLPGRASGIHLTLTGADTSLTYETYVEKLRDQAAELFRLSSELCAKHNNRWLTEFYRQMSGWVRKRSTSNVLWIIVLHHAICDTLQHAIVRFAEPEFSQEFEEIEIAIDRSFISRDSHRVFWREWLRSFLLMDSSRLMTIKEWSHEHPFKRKYVIHRGLLDLKDLFQNHTDFRDSKAMVGLQIVDICANIFYRHYRNDPDTRAFRILRPRIVGEHGAELRIISVDERSLHRDALSNHVQPFDVEEFKRLADDVNRE